VQKTQLDACSGGKLKIMPATGTGITDGVMEVVLTGKKVKGANRFTVEGWVDDAVEAKITGISISGTILCMCFQLAWISVAQRRTHT
jgi:hypothetical protein